MQSWVRPTVRQRRTTNAATHARTPAGMVGRVLHLQQQAGNRAVASLLTGAPQLATGSRLPVQRRSSPELSPVATLQPAGALSEADWATAYRKAKAKPSPEAYAPLIRDIAVTAGMEALGAGFVPTRIPVTDGKAAKPGLNMSMDPGDEPGHAGWVDSTGTYGLPLNLSKDKALNRQIVLTLSVGALHEDKGLSLVTARHEMVHARHKQKLLEAVRAWQAVPARRRPSLDDWLAQQTSKRKGAMSALDAALIGKGAKDARANTEVLAYVEGFSQSYHRRAATLADAGPAFFELLGAVETTKLLTWKQADPPVRTEAITRLQEYHATLGVPHQRLWKQWLDQQLGRVGADVHRKDFLTRLSAFVT